MSPRSNRNSNPKWMRNLPKTILETKSAPRARGALELIEEAGGVGMLEEYDPEEKPRVEITEEEPNIATVAESNCLKCGFPLKKDDEYCQFCHTPYRPNPAQLVVDNSVTGASIGYDTDAFLSIDPLDPASLKSERMWFRLLYLENLYASRKPFHLDRFRWKQVKDTSHVWVGIL